MANTTNPMPELPPPPPVSKRTLAMAGLLVDWYGLDEVAADATTTSVSVLWLHHPRLRARDDMANIAARCIGRTAETGPNEKHHRLIAAAFDQRNHGSRLVSTMANDSWRGGNSSHAQDMFGLVAGTVADTRLLIDLVGAYGLDDNESSSSGTGILPFRPGMAIVQHLVLGVSLGGHSGWQLMFADDRVTAGALIIGCPDYMGLMADRARLSKLATYAGSEASFLGSRDFPPALVAACCRHDPKAITFGTAPVAWPSSAAGETHLHDLLRRRIAAKRFLVCSGGDDKLVPYRWTQPFTRVLERVAETWPDLALTVHDRVYDGIGHGFSPAMVVDAVQFVADNVAEAAAAKAPSRSNDSNGPKI